MHTELTDIVTEKKSPSLGNVRRYMNGAIYIESGTESETKIAKKVQVKKSGIKINSTICQDDNNLAFTKLIAKKIERNIREKRIIDQEIRVQEAQKCYEGWLQKKKAIKAEQARLKLEADRESEKKRETENQLRLLENDLKYKLWLKKKEQQELEKQWKELKQLRDKS